MAMQPPRRVPYLGYTLVLIYLAFVSLNITFMVIFANRLSVAYQNHQYAELAFQLCMEVLAAVAFRFLLQFGRFAFFRQPAPEV